MRFGLAMVCVLAFGCIGIALMLFLIKFLMGGGL